MKNLLFSLLAALLLLFTGGASALPTAPPDTLQIKQLLDESLQFYYRGELKQGAAAATEARTMLESNTALAAAKPFLIARSQLMEGSCRGAFGELQTGIGLLVAAKSGFEKAGAASEWTVRVYMGLANLLLLANQPDAVEQCTAKAEELMQSPDFPKNDTLRAGISYAKAMAKKTSNEALPLLAEALEWAERANLPSQQVQILSRQSAVALSKDQLPQAKKLADRAYKLAESSGHPIAEMMAYQALGPAATEGGNPAQGIEDTQKAIEMAERFFSPMHPMQIELLIDLGNQETFTSQYRKALNTFERALRLAERLKYDPDGIAENVSSIHNNRGELYFELGELDQALAEHRTALARREKARLAEQADLSALFSSYNNIALTLLTRALPADIEPGIQSARKALECLPNTAPSRHSAFALLGIGLVLQQNFAEAEKYLRDALAVQLEIYPSDHFFPALTRRQLGDLFLKKGDFADAEKIYQEALDSLQTKGELSSRSLTMKLAAQASMGKLRRLQALRAGGGATDAGRVLLKNSEDFYRKGLETLLQLRLQFSAEETTQAFQKDKRQFFEGAFETAALRYESGERGKDFFNFCLDVAEKNRALTLLSAFQQNADHAQAFPNLPAATLERERAVRSNLLKADMELRVLGDRAVPRQDTSWEKPRMKWDAALADSRKFLKSLSKSKNKAEQAYFQFKYGLPTVPLADLQRRRRDGRVLVEYLVGAEQSFALVVAADSVHIARLPELPLDWIAEFRSAVEMEPSRDSFGIFKEKYFEYAPKLYDCLVRPIRPLLGSCKKLVIVPDGPLFYIPFDALLTEPVKIKRNAWKTHPYLLNELQVSYGFSASLQEQMFDKKHRQRPSRRLFGLAPFFGWKYGRVDAMPTSRADLDFAHQKLGGAKGDLLAVGDAANAGLFLENMASAQVLYLLTHAFSRGGSEESGILFAGKDSLVVTLPFWKIYEKTLNADLVVFFACKAAFGRLKFGEGVISLSHACAFAGAKSLTTTLWSVELKSSSELMHGFFERMPGGAGSAVLEKDAALHGAKLAMLQTDGNSNYDPYHPHFWAGFVFFGDYSPLSKLP